MGRRTDRGGDTARVLLAAIRIVNGAAGVVAPRVVARKLGTQPDAEAAALYPLRLFGIRTMVVGAELLLRDRKLRPTALDAAVLIHASDTLAAALGGLRGDLPRKVATRLTLLSAGNTALALAARQRGRTRA